MMQKHFALVVNLIWYFSFPEILWFTHKYILLCCQTTLVTGQ